MDVAGLVEALVENDAFDRLVNDPLSQFGPPEGRLLGAEILPERIVLENRFTEEGIRYRSLVANHGTRYSPVQRKKGLLVGNFEVELGYSDIGTDLNGAEYDAFVRLMRRAYGRPGLGPARGSGVAVPDIPGMAEMLRWADLGLVRPMHMRNELDRWAAIVSASVTMLGDNNYTEVVAYPNPSGHRVHAGTTWSNDANDPWTEIVARVNFLAGKGYSVGRIITGNDVIQILTNNAKMRARAGYLSVVSGTVTGLAGLLSLAELNALGARDGLPPFERYDKKYFTPTADGFVFPRGTMVFLAATGRDEEIDRGDQEPVILQNTLGYVGVGVAAGQVDPGMVTRVKYVEDGKNSHVDGQAWQASLPVIGDPEALTTIDQIA